MYKGTRIIIFINKLQNDFILSIFKIWKVGNIRFVANLIGDIYWNFYDDDVITVTSRVLSQCSILPSSFLLQLTKCWRALRVTRKVYNINKQTCLNVKHWGFSCQRTVQIHLNIHPNTGQYDRMRESTAVIVASVVETTQRRGSSSSTTLSRRWTNFLHQTCIAGLVKYLSPTARISGCSLWDDFNVAISNVYKWRHSDVIVIKLSSYWELNPLQNVHFEILIV